MEPAAVTLIIFVASHTASFKSLFNNKNQKTWPNQLDQRKKKKEINSGRSCKANRIFLACKKQE